VFINNKHICLSQLLRKLTLGHTTVVQNVLLIANFGFIKTLDAKTTVYLENQTFLKCSETYINNCAFCTLKCKHKHLIPSFHFNVCDGNTWQRVPHQNFLLQYTKLVPPNFPYLLASVESKSKTNLKIPTYFCQSIFHKKI